MAKNHSIEPFPADIDRDYFGAWLSGFVDGEGCFRLVYDPRKTGQPVPVAQFCIGLRSDDGDILKVVQSYFSCGYIYDDPRSYSKLSLNPKTSFRVSRTIDLLVKVMPHFDKRPLLAKKKKDYCVWREGVLLLNEVLCRPRTSFGGKGRVNQWTKDERERFCSLFSLLSEQRKYSTPPLELPPKTDSFRSGTIFDYVEVNGTMTDDDPTTAE